MGKMKKYMLICAEKGSYDRPIDISIGGIYDTLKEASNELRKYITINFRNEFLEAVKNKHDYVCIDDNNHYMKYMSDYLSYYSSGCPGDNEYEGETYQIFEVNNEVKK